MKVLLTAVLISSVSYNVTEAFQTAKHSSLDIVNVYAAAAQINPYADYSTRAAQQAHLYAVSSRLEPMAYNVASLDDPAALLYQR